MTAAREAIESRDRICAVALFAVALAVYVATSSAHLLGGDNAELVTIFAAGGVAHPSGYPLYCILLRLLAWMPGGAVLGSARVTAVLGALSVAALYRACRGWGGSPGASLVAVAAYAISPLAWRLATEAEVFALNALLAALLLRAAAPGAAIAPGRRVVVLAGLAGLALTNQETIVLLAPVGLLATWRALRALEEWPRRIRVGLLGLAAFGAGLLPYLYCYEVGRAAGDRYVWGEPGTLGGLWRHATRADYGTFRLMASDEGTHGGANVALYFAQTGRHALGVLLVIGLLGLGKAFLRSPAAAKAAPVGPSERRDVLALAATWALAGPVFAVFLDTPEGGGAMLVERFRLLPEVVLTIGVAWGLDAWRRLREGRATALAGAGVVVVAIGALHSWPQVRAEHTNALELYTENTLRGAPPGALILGTGDYRLFSFLYEATARKLRPDVTYIDPHLLAYDWYRARAGRALGAPIAERGDPLATAIVLVEQALGLGRPVLVTDVFDPQLVRVFPTYPVGTLIRLLPRGTAPPEVESVERENLDVFARFARGELADPRDEWASAVLPAYQRPWIALARIYERRGEEARAKAARGRAAEWTFLREEE